MCGIREVQPKGKHITRKGLKGKRRRSEGCAWWVQGRLWRLERRFQGHTWLLIAVGGYLSLLKGPVLCLCSILCNSFVLVQVQVSRPRICIRRSLSLTTSLTLFEHPAVVL